MTSRQRNFHRRFLTFRRPGLCRAACCRVPAASSTIRAHGCQSSSARQRDAAAVTAPVRCSSAKRKQWAYRRRSSDAVLTTVATCSFTSPRVEHTEEMDRHSAGGTVAGAFVSSDSTTSTAFHLAASWGPRDGLYEAAASDSIALLKGSHDSRQTRGTGARPVTAVHLWQ